jgi:hypothetical protein
MNHRQTHAVITTVYKPGEVGKHSILDLPDILCQSGQDSESVVNARYPSHTRSSPEPDVRRPADARTY